MRHNKKFNHLGRTKSHREAMLANMTVSLIKAKRINTTVAKAKAMVISITAAYRPWQKVPAKVVSNSNK